MITIFSAQIAGFESGVEHGVNPKYKSIVKAIVK